MTRKESKMQDKRSEINYYDNVRWVEDYERQSEINNELYYQIAGLDAVAGMKVLEAGCGTGALGRRICKNDNSVVGIDISPEMVAIANGYATQNYHAIVGDLEDQSAFESETFDLILCPMVLHHLPTIAKVTDNFSEWLKAEGRIIIFEANGSNPVNKLNKLIAIPLRAINERYFEQKAIIPSRNDRFQSPETFLTELKKRGFSILVCRYLFTFVAGSEISTVKNLLSYLSYLLYRCAYLLLPKSLGATNVLIIAEKGNNGVAWKL